jgi:hypothetical protein
MILIPLFSIQSYYLVCVEAFLVIYMHTSLYIDCRQPLMATPVHDYRASLPLGAASSGTRWWPVLMNYTISEEFG